MNKTEEEKQEQVTVMNWFNSKITEIKREYWEKISAEIQHDLYGERYKIYLKLEKNNQQIHNN